MRKNNEREIAGFLMMLGSAFVKHKPTQANLFVNGLKMAIGEDPDQITKIAHNITSKNKKDKYKVDIIDIDFEEIKD